MVSGKPTGFSSERIKKYLLYAIGEIVLVVLGILIALSINNWNQEKQDRIQEQQILKQLLTEYTNNLNQINQKIDIRNEQIQSILKLLAFRKRPVGMTPVDSFNIHLSRVLTRPTFDPELGVTEELTHSGKLYQITNVALRNKVSAFTSFLGELREEEMVIFNNVEERIYPFVNEHYQIGNALEEFLADNEFNSKHKLNTSDYTFSFQDLIIQVDIADLLYHPTFEDHLMTMILNTDYTNEQSEGVRKKIQEIIDLAKNEINP